MKEHGPETSSQQHPPRRPSARVAADTEPLDLAAIRAQLAARGNREYWRSLEELAARPQFREFLEREFPRQAAVWDEGLDRRSFLSLAAAALALAGVSGCKLNQPEEKIVPYVRQPEKLVPGEPLVFATAMPLFGSAEGLLVTSRMGRPIKIEGNGEHPASLGAANVFAQASLLDLYDPDRSQTVLDRGTISTWPAMVVALEKQLPRLSADRGAGLALLTETVTSPTLGAQLKALLAAWPQALWHQYEPLHRDNVRSGARLAFGEPLVPRYQFERADVILAIDCDFLTQLPGAVRYAHDFGHRRKPPFASHADIGKDASQADNRPQPMNRLYAIESTPTLVGAVADHRWPLRAGDVEGCVRDLARRLGVSVAETMSDRRSGSNNLPDEVLAAIAADLKAHRGSSLVLVGDSQPPAVHALAHAINRQLENAGRTVVYSEPIEAEPVDAMTSLAALVESLRGGQVRMLLVLGGNPVYNAPGELDFSGALRQALGIGGSAATGWSRPAHDAPLEVCVHLGLYEDETSELAHWHIPQAHYLEAWSDARAYDGTVSIVQPLIAPLYGGKTAHEIVAVLAGQSRAVPYEMVQNYWRDRLGREQFATGWRKMVHDGWLADSQSPEHEPEWTFTDRSTPARAITAENENGLPIADGARVEVVFLADPAVADGRFANNGWLQELPRPLTKLVWDNAALASAQTCQRLGLTNGDVVELRFAGGRTVEAPIWLAPGQADDCLGLILGYGRTRCGRVGAQVGYNAYPGLPASGARWLSDVPVRKTGRRQRLVATHDHWSMEGRDLVRATTLDELRPGSAGRQSVLASSSEPAAAGARKSDQLNTLYEQDFSYPAPMNKWGMVIDQTACIGCSACVVACQAENNIPIVGREQCDRGREMHWLRVDRYHRGPLDNPETFFQPVPCMHCEDAPCELVCPVGATVHDAEGLNNMVYNRCVGTRYCSNNCPYKVRRFNFLDFTHIEEPSLKLLQNPEVTVRSRGVMEKCSYCVQRIDAARITAKKENRPIRDGEFQTACQATCPTRAITFGNLNDPGSAVAELQESPLRYALLEELGTRPRTTYLARVSNPNPALVRGPLADTPVPHSEPSGQQTGVDPAEEQSENDATKTIETGPEAPR